jgi:hypothetical protein
MISNLPTLTTRKVTVEIDVTLAESQMSRIKDILQAKDTNLTRAERSALDGTRNLLSAMTDTPVPAPPRTHAKHISPEDVNRIRDLFMAGQSPGGISHRLGCRRLAVQRLIRGDTYGDVPYEPSEFHPPDIKKWAGTDKFPWTKEWNPNES